MSVSLNKKYKLHKHQKDAIKKYLSIFKSKNNYGINGMIVSHEMGLGKTLTALYLTTMMNKKVKCKKNLYVCPKTIMTEVVRDAKKFFGDSFKILIAHRDFMDVSKLSVRKISKYDMVITTYEAVTSSYNYDRYKYLSSIFRDRHYYASDINKERINYRCKGVSCFHKIDWNLLFADESQKMGNIKNLRSKAMLSLMGHRKLCLTGTSMRNNPGELLTQFKFIGLNKPVKVKDWYDYFIKNKLTKYMSIRDFQNTDILLAPIFYKEVEVPIIGTHKLIYDICNNYVQKGLGRGMNMLTKINRLRQAANMPWPKTSGKSVTGKEIEKIINKKTGNYLKNIESVCVSAKIKECARVIQHAMKRNEKVLLYSTFTYSFPIIEKGLKKLCGVKTFILSGQTPHREELIDNFRKYDGSAVMITNYVVGATGLNLTEANHVILYERWWNSAVMKQGIARAYRYGQKRPVHVYFLSIIGTIETDLIKKTCSGKDNIIKQFEEPAKKESGYYETKKNLSIILQELKNK